MNLKQAGREIVKLNIGNAVKNLVSPIVPATNFGYPYEDLELRSDTFRGQNGIWYFNQPLNGESGKDIFFPWNGKGSAVKAFESCAPLFSIIIRSTSAYINGKTWIMDKKGKESNSDAAVRIRKLLKNPNPLQTGIEFEAQYRVFKKLFGYAVILPITPAGFDNTYAEQLWLLPPQFVNFHLNAKKFYNIKSRDELINRVTFDTPDGESSPLRLKDLVIHKDVLPAFDIKIIPSSPLQPLQPQINNIIGAYQSRGTLIYERGALGILSQEIDPAGTTPLQPEDEEELHKKFSQYGLNREQRKFILSPMPLKWQQMGIPTSSLMLFEEIKDDVEQLCDAIGFQFELLSNSKGSTFANKSEASKVLYQNIIIPEAIIDAANWDLFFNCERYGLKIDKDYSHVPALQENKKEMAMARNTMSVSLERDFKNNLLTYNRVLELMEENTIPELEGKYYRDLVAEGWVFGNTSNSNNGQTNQTDNQGGSGENQSGQGQGS